MAEDPGPESGARGRGVALAVAAAGVAVVVAVGAFAFSSSSAGRSRGDVVTAASFDLPDLEGPGRVRLAAYRGKPVVVNLFASWCVECQTELPAFARVAAELRGKVQFIGVNSQETGDGRAMASQYHLGASGFALARDVGGSNGSGLHDAFKAPGMPATIFYDAEGHQVGRDIAALSEATLRAQLHQFYGV